MVHNLLVLPADEKCVRESLEWTTGISRGLTILLGLLSGMALK